MFSVFVWRIGLCPSTALYSSRMPRPSWMDHVIFIDCDELYKSIQVPSQVCAGFDGRLACKSQLDTISRNPAVFGAFFTKASTS